MHEFVLLLYDLIQQLAKKLTQFKSSLLLLDHFLN